jgi:type II secretory pathway pseudopilin PulG
MKKYQEGTISMFEIITIVAVLGILVAIAVPNFLGARDRALVKDSINMLYNIRQCLEMYRIENANYPSGIVDFQTLYIALSNHGLEANPQDNFSKTTGFVSYSSSGQMYTLVVRARNRTNTPLTATSLSILTEPQFEALLR